MKGRSLAPALLIGLTLALAACVTPVAGPEFQVNSTTAGTQSAPSVANVGPDSHFVVTWTAGGGQDGDLKGVYGRLFDETGTPLAGEFLVNVVTTGDQALSSVASNPTGNFVVAWTHLETVAAYEIRARRFQPSAEPLGGEIVVNTYTSDSQVIPDVAVDTAGNFVVVWASGPGHDGDGYGIFARRFDANGDPLSDEFQVNQQTTGTQTQPRIAMNSGGDFLIVWGSPQDASGDAVIARRYAANGNPLGGEFRVNTTEALDQHEPDAAYDAAGNAIVVWSSDGQDGDGSGVYGQRFDPNGNKIGPEFNVNTFTTVFQGDPRVAASPSPDDFTVTWQSNSQEGDPGIASQAFDETGRRSMMEQPVNSYGTAAQIQPAIAAQPNGQVVIAWASEGADGSDFGISARVGGFPRIEFTRVDVPHNIAGSAPAGASNLNGVLEVGEHVTVEPVYRNLSNVPLALTGTLALFGLPGPTYSVDDDAGDYGTLDPGELDDCFGTPGGCYGIGVVGERPKEQHSDVQIVEELSYHGFERAAAVHIGESFPDVPVGTGFYRLHREPLSQRRHRRLRRAATTAPPTRSRGRRWRSSSSSRAAARASFRRRRPEQPFPTFRPTIPSRPGSRSSCARASRRAAAAATTVRTIP